MKNRIGIMWNRIHTVYLVVFRFERMNQIIENAMESEYRRGFCDGIDHEKTVQKSLAKLEAELRQKRELKNAIKTVSFN